ncbi:MAG: hypothetical protein NUV65_01720 [Candidatus Roizmanbacteria bacterium]|nr:hypothetical protein [Candidatus Roizmanbacteria bacterium]
MHETSQLLNYLNQQVQMGELGFSESDVTGESNDKNALQSRVLELFKNESGSSYLAVMLVMFGSIGAILGIAALVGFASKIEMPTFDVGNPPSRTENYPQQDEPQPVYPTNTPQPMPTQVPVFQQPAASQPSSSGGNSCRGLQPRVPINVVIDCGRLPWDIGNVPACDGVSTASMQTQTCAVAGSTGIDISNNVFGADSRYCLSAASKAVQSCSQ